MLLRYHNRLVILVILLTVISAACSRENDFIGTYKSIPANPPEFANLYLELNKGGGGIRRINGNDFSFRWRVTGHQIRIHTQLGGTIVGHVWGDFLVLRFPGPLAVYLMKIK